MNDCIGNVWLLSPLIGIIVLFFLYLLSMYLINRHQKNPFSKHFFWQVDLKKILNFPLKVGFVFFAFYLSLLLFTGYFGCFIALDGMKVVRDCVIVLSLSWIAYRWKNELLKKVSKAGAAHAVNKLISISIWVLTGLMLLRIFHLDVLPLLAFGGIGAAALGFSAKDLIGNFLGGAMLSFTHPFSVGEMILLPEKELEGTVEEIGWCLTSIRDRDKRPVYLPNSVFSNLLVVNLSRMSRRRIRDTLWIRYEDALKIETLLKEIRSYLETQKEIDSTLPVLLYLNRLGEYSLEVYMEIYTFATELKKHLVVREEVLQGILKIVEGRGAKLSYPTTNIKLETVQTL